MERSVLKDVNGRTLYRRQKAQRKTLLFGVLVLMLGSTLYAILMVSLGPP